MNKRKRDAEDKEKIPTRPGHVCLVKRPGLNVPICIPISSVFLSCIVFGCLCLDPSSFPPPCSSHAPSKSTFVSRGTKLWDWHTPILGTHFVSCGTSFGVQFPAGCQWRARYTLSASASLSETPPGLGLANVCPNCLDQRCVPREKGWSPIPLRMPLPFKTNKEAGNTATPLGANTAFCGCQKCFLSTLRLLACFAPCVCSSVFTRFGVQFLATCPWGARCTLHASWAWPAQWALRFIPHTVACISISKLTSPSVLPYGRCSKPPVSPPITIPAGRRAKQADTPWARGKRPLPTDHPGTDQRSRTSTVNGEPGLHRREWHSHAEDVCPKHVRLRSPLHLPLTPVVRESL